MGQSATLYLKDFPNSHIYCFEPVDVTFNQLQELFKGNGRVECFRLALGAANSTGEMALCGNSDQFFLLRQSKEVPTTTYKTEAVEITTLDEFCRTKGIDHIDYLKVDTEGGDLDVLRGSVTLLREQRIDFVQVEAGMNPTNKLHVRFEELKRFLETHKYYLFGIYEQVNEFFSGQPHLRRTNPVFISCSMIDKSKSMEIGQAEALSRQPLDERYV